MVVDMDRFTRQVFGGSALGIGLGIALLLLGLGTTALFGNYGRDIFGYSIGLLFWPTYYLAELDRHRGWHILYENPINYSLLLVVYWVLIGQLLFPVVLWCRARRRKRNLGKSSAGFPVRPDTLEHVEDPEDNPPR